MHNLPIDNNLVNTDSVVLRIRRVRRSGDLNLAPLAIGRHNLALGGAVLELLVDTLLIDAALALDKG